MIALKKDVIILSIIFIISTLLIFIFHPQFNVDFYNYQLYNGWAFLNNRIGIDFMPADIRTYWTPYLDAFQYLMITVFNKHPFIYTTIMNFDNVLALFLIYKISDKIIPNNIKYKNISITLIILFILFSPVMYNVIDSSKNDMILAVIILLAFYLYIQIFDDKCTNKNRNIFIIGILIGIATGLKLTASIYAITFLICIFCCHKYFKNIFKTVLIYLIFLTLTFFIIDGYWLYKLYTHFQNPFFPMFNNIFHSNYVQWDNFYTEEYRLLRASTLKKFLLYPFIFYKTNDFYGCLEHSWDLRYAINIICSLVILFISNKHFKKFKNINQIYFLALFCLISYEINIVLFGLYRFIITTFLLFGLNLYLTLTLLIKKFNNKTINIIMLFMIFLTLITQRNTNSTNLFLLFNKEHFLISNTNYKIENNADVFLLSFGTSGFLINQNKNANYYGYMYNYLSKNTFYNLKNIFKNGKKTYLLIKKKDFYSNYNTILESVNYFSDETKYIQNCKIIKESSLSNTNNTNILCKLEYK